MDLSKINPTKGGCSANCPYHEDNHCAFTGERVSITKSPVSVISPCTPDNERKALEYKRKKSKELEEYNKTEYLESQIIALEEGIEKKEVELSRLKEDLARLKEQRNGDKEAQE